MKNIILKKNWARISMNNRFVWRKHQDFISCKLPLQCTRPGPQSILEGKIEITSTILVKHFCCWISVVFGRRMDITSTIPPPVTHGKIGLPSRTSEMQLPFHFRTRECTRGTNRQVEGDGSEKGVADDPLPPKTATNQHELSPSPSVAKDPRAYTLRTLRLRTRQRNRHRPLTAPRRNS